MKIGTDAMTPKEAEMRERKQLQYSPDFSAMPEPNVFIQWKGADLCADFRCECGVHHHIDADFVYAIRCGSCGADEEWRDIPVEGE